MLHADKRALEQNLKVNLLRIREKELHFYTENCVAIGTQASLLAGFAYAGLIQVDIPEHVNETLKTAYLCVTTTAMGLELIAVLNSTLCSMLGPGLALRGPDGSMNKAVDEMMEEYRLTFFFFGTGLVAFHFSALIFAWLEFVWPVAMAMSVTIFLFLYGMYHYFLRIYARFKVPPSMMITGRFDTDVPVYDKTVTATDMRRANAAHTASQSVGQRIDEYLHPVAYPRDVLRQRHGPSASDVAEANEQHAEASPSRLAR